MNQKSDTLKEYCSRSGSDCRDHLDYDGLYSLCCAYLQTNHTGKAITFYLKDLERIKRSVENEQELLSLRLKATIGSFLFMATSGTITESLIDYIPPEQLAKKMSFALNDELNIAVHEYGGDCCIYNRFATAFQTAALIAKIAVEANEFSLLSSDINFRIRANLQARIEENNSSLLKES